LDGVFEQALGILGCVTIADVDNRRNTLIREASRLFRDKGYDRTTVRDIARAVGLQSGSIFYHFRNKEEILQAVMENSIRRIIEAARAALDGVVSPRERLTVLTRSHLEILLGGTQDDMFVLLYEWRSLPGALRRPLLELRAAYERIWREVVTAACEEGLLRGEPALTARLMLGTLNWTVQWYQPGGGLTPSQLGDRVLDMLLHDGD